MRLNKSAGRSRFIIRLPMISCCPANLDENQPAGTWAGEFSTNDPDDPSGVKDYLYTLVEGNGSTDNANFVLELNGTLRSATTLDFESRNAFQIRVRSTDEFGGYKEEAFQVKVTDCFVPVVETLSASEVQASSAKLSGRLEDAGGLSIWNGVLYLGPIPFRFMAKRVSRSLRVNFPETQGNSMAKPTT